MKTTTKLSVRWTVPALINLSSATAEEPLYEGLGSTQRAVTTGSEKAKTM